MTPLSPIAQVAVIYGGYGFLAVCVVCFTWYMINKMSFEDDTIYSANPRGFHKAGDDIEFESTKDGIKVKM